MRSYKSFNQIYLYNAQVDFRKSINGLMQIVKFQMNLNPLEEGSLFIFVARNRWALKTLYFDHSGFALWYKRLEGEKFKLPKPNSSSHSLTSKELGLFLEGYDIFKMKPHKILGEDALF